MAESKGASEENEDEKEDMNGIMAKSLGELKITKTLLENSLEASNPYITYLMGQLDSYSSWEMNDQISTESIKAYSKGKKEFRITLNVQSYDAEKVGKFFFDLDKKAKWDNMKWSLIKKEGETHNVAQILYPHMAGKMRFIEYILLRNFKQDEHDDSVIIVERSLLLPQSESPDIKRVHINGCVRKISTKVDIDSEVYVEIQILVTAEEGFTNTSEYLKCMKKEMETGLMRLNKQLRNK